MEIGLGIDGRLVLSDTEQADVAAEAAALGYASLWTPARDDDPFLLCARWHQASGLATGISVLPLQRWSPEQLVAGTRMALERTAGRFTLGVGSGTERDAPIRKMRDLAAILGPALVDPIYLGALGPQMLHLAGERYDGAALNWSSPQHTLWSRERVAAGALRAGRDPREIRIHQYIRVCVDADVSAARRGLATMVLSYAMARPGLDPTKGYRGHFARMGFDAALAELEAMRARGADDGALADRLPDELLARVGYWGPPETAAAGFEALTAGLDIAVVRVVAATKNDADCVRLAMRSCVRATA
ncbi:MAG TPA: LLM class flavin-dependent oxidoreductase [Candidatus Limnocylindria bacterium]|nr:LLM class flavin-dependent oxidoreductase [Candidatus Limnocylindria bacterium]